MQCQRIGSDPHTTTHLGQENGVHLGMMLEMLKNAHTLNLRSSAMDIELSKFPSVVLYNYQ